MLIVEQIQKSFWSGSNFQSCERSLLRTKNCGCHTIETHWCGRFTYSKTVQCRTLTQASRRCCDAWCATQVLLRAAQVTQRLSWKILGTVSEFWSTMLSMESRQWRSMSSETTNKSLCDTPNTRMRLKMQPVMSGRRVRSVSLCHPRQ